MKCDPDPDLRSGTHYFPPGATVCECRKRVRLGARIPFVCPKCKTRLRRVANQDAFEEDL